MTEKQPGQTRTAEGNPSCSACAAMTFDYAHVMREHGPPAWMHALSGTTLKTYARINAFISRTACSTPTNKARLTMVCPILSSCKWGNVFTSEILV